MTTKADVMKALSWRSFNVKQGRDYDVADFRDGAAIIGAGRYKAYGLTNWFETNAVLYKCCVTHLPRGRSFEEDKEIVESAVASIVMSYPSVKREFTK